MQSVLEAVGKIEKEAKVASSDIRVIKRMNIGQAIRQGDIYLLRIPASDSVCVLHPNQLVAGINPGSRHVVTSPARTYVTTTRPKGLTDIAILGPVVVSNKRFILTHPEHAHFSLPPGTYQCVQQMDARTNRAVVD